MDEMKIFSLLKDLEKLETMQSNINKQVNAVKDQLKEVLENDEKMENDLFIMRFTLCEKITVDQKRLETEKPDLFKEYKKATLFRRFSYKFK